LDQELSRAEEDLLHARKAMKESGSAEILKSWGLVEWLRRIALMLVNLVSGHALVASVSVLLVPMLRKSR